VARRQPAGGRWRATGGRGAPGPREPWACWVFPPRSSASSPPWKIPGGGCAATRATRWRPWGRRASRRCSGCGIKAAIASPRRWRRRCWKRSSGIARAREASPVWSETLAWLANSWLGTGLLLYSIAVCAHYAVLAVLAFVEAHRQQRWQRLADRLSLFEGDLAPPISVLVPAYNEGPTIVSSVRSLMQ